MDENKPNAHFYQDIENALHDSVTFVLSKELTKRKLLNVIERTSGRKNMFSHK